MKKPLRVFLAILIVYFVFGLVVGFYEYLNGGPWYTYVNFRGERLVLGQDTAAAAADDHIDQEVPSAFQVIDAVFYPVFYFTRNLYA